MRAAAAAIACVLVSFSSVARADPPVRYAATYPCGSDELSRRTGLLLDDRLPHVPAQTHGCPQVDVSGSAVWASIDVPAPATITVTATALVGAPCAFVEQDAHVTSGCPSVSVPVHAGPAIAGASGSTTLVTSFEVALA